MSTKIRRRPSLRLQGIQYREPGAYLVTICTAGRQRLFGAVRSHRMELNRYGRIVEAEWRRSFALRKNLRPDAYVVMPDHMHAIVWFRDDITVGAGSGPPHRLPGESISDPHYVSRNLSALVRDFKGAVTRALAGGSVETGKSVWQRSFHDRVIRSEAELAALREYVMYNAQKCRM